VSDHDPEWPSVIPPINLGFTIVKFFIVVKAARAHHQRPAQIGSLPL
jgi:hypothetical protein